MTDHNCIIKILFHYKSDISEEVNNSNITFSYYNVIKKEINTNNFINYIKNELTIDEKASLTNKKIDHIYLYISNPNEHNGINSNDFQNFQSLQKKIEYLERENKRLKYYLIYY